MSQHNVTKSDTGAQPTGVATQVTPQPRRAPSAGRRPRPLRAEDREFLPGAIEIVDTPPSPIAVSMIWLICIVFAAAIGWAYFGKVNIYAVARGKVQITGRSKVVQPIEPGKVSAVLVKNGTAVEKGDSLVRLDATDTSADEKRLTEAVIASEAEIARRKAAIEAANLNNDTPPQIEFNADTSEFVRSRERNVLAADLAHLNASLQTLNAQSAQQLAAEHRFRESIAEREKLLALSSERVRMRKDLKDLGAGSRALIIDAESQYESELTSQVADQGQLNETIANIAVTKRKIAEATSQFIAEQNQKLAEAERKADQQRQDLIKARSKNEQMLIVAPVSGIVEQLAVTTVGQVVGSGQVLMTIVPRDAPLEVHALLANQDIGFVHAGDPAVIKVDSFPFTRYGTLQGRVINIASDAVDAREATNLSDASAAVKPQNAASSQVTSNPVLVFPVIVALASHAININGQDVQLMPGMTVTVEIETGTRRIIDYVLSPLREMVGTAAHER
jgi:membrane fusion protein, hemolysin D